MKILNTFEQMQLGGVKATILHYRDWLLGGDNFEWSYTVDVRNGNLILKRN